jgi:hypothetical protein
MKLHKCTILDAIASGRRFILFTCFPLFAFLFAAPRLNATPPIDPICGAPSSLENVRAMRRQRMEEGGERRGSFGLQQVVNAPRLSIELLNFSEPPRLILSGLSGRTYHLESSDNPASSVWKPWLSVNLGDQSLIWSDGLIGRLPRQFFRLRSAGPDEFGDSASNFRLLDQTGAARDLYYHTHLSAIGVLAAGTSLTNVVPLIPTLDALAQRHGTNIQIWILLSDPAPVRSNVVAQARALGIDHPILTDSDNLAARSLGLTRAGEVALVRPPTFDVVYRGEVARPTQLTVADSFLGRALDGLNGSQAPGFLLTPVSGEILSHVSGQTPDYASEIAPIFRKYCASCHYPNSVAPFALTHHGIAELWAPAMKHALLSGKMPPWHADPEFGHFANDLSLPGNLKSALIRWIDAGAPRGSGPDPLAELPPPPAHDQWPVELGEPDALVTIPVQNIRATGVEPYRYIYVQTPNPTNVWLRAAIIRPSNYRAVHHYLVWPGRIGNRRSMDSSTYEAHIAEFFPGFKPFQLPADSHIALGASNWLTFNLHYTPYGAATNDQPILALWYHKSKPARTWGVTAIGNLNFAIHPFARDHAVQADWTTSSRIKVHRLNPHMHLRGKRMKYEVFYPGGSRETLLSVPDYDFNWQLGYELSEPKVLPPGSRIVVSGAFDNSPENLANPDPSATVRWGDQSSMEMFVGFVEYTQQQ